MKSILLFFFLCWGLACQAQIGYWKSSLATFPHEAINDIHFLDSTNGISVCEGGVIGRTSNAGNSWVALNQIVFDNLYDVYPATIHTMYIAGSKGQLLKSTNGGFNWNIMSFPVADDIFQLHFTAADTGYAVTQNAIRKTTDGGNSWITVLNTNTNWYGTYDSYKINFFTPDSGYVGFGPHLFITDNGGASWTYSLFTAPIHTAEFITPLIGYAYSHSADTIRFYKTTNGGQAWNQIYAAHCQTIGYSRIDVVDTAHMVAVYDNPGNNGIRILTTTNGGVNWLNTTHYNFEYTRSIFSTDIHHLWVGGLWGSFGRSSNLGATLIDYNYTNEILGATAFYALDSNRAFMAVTNKIRRTLNGGLSWNVVNPPNMNTNEWATGMQWQDTSVGFLLSDAYSLYRTLNAGSSWTFCGHPLGIKGFKFFNQNFGMAVLNTNAIAVTTNGGSLWNIPTSASFFIPKNLNYIDSLHWYFFTDTAIVRTSNAGQSWVVQAGNFNNFTSGKFMDSLQGFFSTYDSLYTTTNGGISYTTVNTSANYPIITGQYLSLQEMALKHSSTFPYHPFHYSTDSGTNWKFLQVPTFKYLSLWQMTDTNHFWFVTSFGTVWRFKPHATQPTLYAPFLNQSTYYTCSGDSVHAKITNYLTYNLSTDTLFAFLKQGNTILQTIPITIDGWVHFATPTIAGAYTLEVKVVSSLAGTLITSVTVQALIPNNPINGFGYVANNPHCSAEIVQCSLALTGMSLNLGYSVELHKIVNGNDSIIGNSLINSFYLDQTAILYFKVYVGTIGCSSPTVFYSSQITINIISPNPSLATLQCSNPNNAVCAGASYSITTNVPNIVGQQNYYQFYEIYSGGQAIIQSGASNQCLVTNSFQDRKFVCYIYPGPGGNCFTTNPIISDTITIQAVTLNTPSLQSVAGQLVTDSVNGATYYWYLNGNLVATTGTHVYQPTSNGSYTVRCSVLGCYSPYSTSVVMIVTGVVTSGVQSLKYSPNPFQDEIKLEWFEGIEGYKLQSALGAVVKEENSKGNVLSLSIKQLGHLPRGLYFLQVRSSNRNSIVIPLVK